MRPLRHESSPSHTAGSLRRKSSPSGAKTTNSPQRVSSPSGTVGFSRRESSPSQTSGALRRKSPRRKRLIPPDASLPQRKGLGQCETHGMAILTAATRYQRRPRRPTKPANVDKWAFRDSEYRYSEYGESKYRDFKRGTSTRWFLITTQYMDIAKFDNGVGVSENMGFFRKEFPYSQLGGIGETTYPSRLWKDLNTDAEIKGIIKRIGK